MPSYRVEDDPVVRELLKQHERAYRAHWRALLDLRRLHLNSDSPDAIRTALVQQIAHDTEHQIVETTKALSRLGWELVPFSKDAKHLDGINRAKAEARARIAETEANPNVTMIVTKVDGIVREFYD